MNAYNTTLQHNTIQLGIRDYGGEGPPLLLLHGGTRNATDWDEIAALLYRYHRVVALDLRSHGHSTPCGATWCFEDVVEDVEAVITHLNLDNPFVGGHSLGGMIAVLYGTRHTECRGVINIDGVGVSIPSHFPEPDGKVAQQRVRDLIEMMIEGTAVPSHAEPILLTDLQVVNRVMEAQIAVQQQGKNAERVAVFTARSFFPHANGTYEENPSPAAQSALSNALITYDLFALVRTVQCPLLFVAAIEQNPPSDEFSTTVAQWRDAIKAEFVTICQRHPNIFYKNILGDHMLVPNNPVPVAASLLSFTQLSPFL